MAGLQLRARHDRSRLVSTAATLYASPRLGPQAAREVTLLDLLDRLLAGGVVIRGQVTLAAADVDLVHLDLAVLVTTVAKLLES